MIISSIPAFGVAVYYFLPPSLPYCLITLDIALIVAACHATLLIWSLHLCTSAVTTALATSKALSTGVSCLYSGHSREQDCNGYDSVDDLHGDYDCWC